jgi:pimeloyl-ACP methyl ester carboxylesterase
VVVGPVGLQKAIHPDGELAMAAGVARAGSLFIVAVNATTGIDEIAAAQPTLPLWFQLYNWADREVLAAVIARAEAAGVRAIVPLVNTPIGVNHQPDFWETTTPEIRTMFLDNARTWTLALAAPPQPPITCDMLHQIKIPILITVGADTRSFFHIAAEGAAACIPGVQFVTIPGRHLAIAQQPEAFNAALLQLLGKAGSQPKT